MKSILVGDLHIDNVKNSISNSDAFFRDFKSFYTYKKILPLNTELIM